MQGGQLAHDLLRGNLVGPQVRGSSLRFELAQACLLAGRVKDAPTA